MANLSLPDTRRKFAGIALIALITIPQTRAANIIWSSSAPADGNWHTATDWTGGIVPGSADQVQASSGSSMISAASTIKYLALDSHFQLTLSGSAANLSVKADATVNYGLYMNSGTLKVQNGATLTTSISSASSNSKKSDYLGNSGAAIIEVSGAGSTATFKQRVALGGGTGQGTTLTIRDGGTMNASSTSIAGLGGQASVLVDGGTFNAGTSGSVGSFNIGNFGSGKLTITNNGVVTNGLSAASIGNQASATGTVDIDSGSWTSSAQIETGGNGKGSLNISGGTVTDTFGYIGRYAGSEGTVTVNGTGKWINSSGLYIGDGGTGTLNLSGATATLTTGSSTNYIGRAAGSTGTANLTNNAVWTLKNITGGNGASTVNFDNATLKANSNQTGFITNVATLNLLTGGATINSNGYKIGNTGCAFSGSGGLTKTGLGTFSLSGTNTFTGATQVNTGILLVNGSTAAGSTVTVGGATATDTPILGGIGTINGPVVISAANGAAAGTLAPGIPDVSNSVGTLTLNSTVNYGSGSIFEWNLQAATTTDPGAVSDASTGTYDKVVVNGKAGSVIGDSAVFKIVLGGNAFSDPFWNTTKRWTDLFTGTGTPANLSSIFSTFAGASINPDGTVTGNAGHFSFNGTSTLTWSAVPEPTGALPGLLLGAGLLRRRRPATGPQVRRH